MAGLLNAMTIDLHDAYERYLWALSPGDERTKGWPLVDSPVPVILFTFAYLAIVWAGPKIMSKRQAFKLTWALVPYNFGLAGLNAYIAIKLLVSSSRLQYSYICQPMEQIDRPDEVQIAYAMWWYFFSKLIEYWDTFFFILRKKTNQLSFLHVYHHSTVFPVWWILIKWMPSGSTFHPAMTNSFVHVLMYSYYGLAALGPTVSKYLWWKKYLTVVQLIQFVQGLIALTLALFFRKCDIPSWMQRGMAVYIMSFLVLFGNFYQRAYTAKFQGKQGRDKKTATNRKLEPGKTKKGAKAKSCIAEDKWETNYYKNGIDITKKLH